MEFETDAREAMEDCPVSVISIEESDVSDALFPGRATAASA